VSDGVASSTATPQTPSSCCDNIVDAENKTGSKINSRNSWCLKKRGEGRAECCRRRSGALSTIALPLIAFGPGFVLRDVRSSRRVTYPPRPAGGDAPSAGSRKCSGERNLKKMGNLKKLGLSRNPGHSAGVSQTSTALKPVRL